MLELRPNCEFCNVDDTICITEASNSVIDDQGNFVSSYQSHLNEAMQSAPGVGNVATPQCISQLPLSEQPD